MPILRKTIARDTHLNNDEAAVYKAIGKKYFDKHSSVNHGAGEYVRVTGATVATTNTVESNFAILKRGLYGRLHHVGEQRLQRYVTEFDFR
ncbi:MAG: family transposase [Hydrocarboniphaga sp.]|uniref:transposase n=1 Tax=Hydrocarboniphaga sp. TaxID=2033016 RepID=UPI0026124DA2|nr:transposase [Hydrocarboniphaga sp.]MDB5972612.1 family transposase [Hydrocarboniphaga sp.]